MQQHSLADIYSKINPELRKVFVVPLIRFTHQRSDYLYLLYQELIEDPVYNVESISVFNHFKLLSGILKNKKAVLHYHWFEFQDLKSLSSMPWKLFCIYLFKLLGGNLVWTIHNEFPHDQKYLALHKYLHKKLARWSDLIHVHCSTAIPLMSDRLKVSEQKFIVLPHPEFPAESYGRDVSINYLNENFGLKVSHRLPIVLMFGNISKYKQIESVASIIVESELKLQLIIAGPVKKGNMDLYKKLHSLSKKHPEILLHPTFVKENVISFFFSAADLCVFNYREILSSGGFVMAKSHERKILAPNKGCLSEEAADPDITLFEDQAELRDRLSEFSDNFNHG